MKTTKFNGMIEAFELDFTLAQNGERSLSELDKNIKNNDPKLIQDIELLKELSWMLRHGKAEIHITE